MTSERKGMKQTPVNRADKALQSRNSLFRFSLFIILAVSGYQLLLCFVHTHFFPVSNALLGGVEVIILVAVFLRIMRSLTLIRIYFILGLLLYFMLIWAVRGEVDLFGPRNLMIILAFYFLGTNLKSEKEANKIVWALSSVVLIFAFFEYFFTSVYLNIFNILSYYVSRGAASAKVLDYMPENLFASGLRPGGRNILPFLGDHRVSSIFLEPVSMGNYAAILAMWFFSLDLGKWGKNLGHLLVAAPLIIACDSRFSSLSVFILFLVRLMPFLHRRAVVLWYPVIAAIILILVFYFQMGDPAQDNMSGRLARSGATLLDMDFFNLLGLNVPRVLPDMGVSYTLEHFGLLLVIVLWLTFSFLKIDNDRGRRFRAMFAIYALCILMVSGTSLFSSKTAGILWLLFGVLSRPTSSAIKERANHLFFHIRKHIKANRANE
jgi:putative polymerase